MEIPKQFDPKDCEDRIYRDWDAAGIFNADPASGKEPYTIVIPPPNVTGVLHAGHAMFVTLQDILIRWRKMQGFDTLWLPGTDHAGIATQMVVSKELEKQGLQRIQMGRESFLEHVWQWKREKGGAILTQLRKLGASCDWSRTKFTLDEDLTRAVRHAFVSLYRDGLIYRGEYIINWCPSCGTALSDLEVEHKDKEGKLFYIRYKGEDGGEGLVVATTRPETLLGDTAVAVHPGDERFASMIGKQVLLPVLGRKIPVIADEMVEREFGTGAVKITPAHDPNDFEAGRRHGLPIIKVMDDKGRMTAEAGPFEGLDRFECRKKIVAELEDSGILIKTETHRHAVGHCQRCRTTLESMVSFQWFLRIDSLAKPAIEAVESGEIEIIPDHWQKVYVNWMKDLHDWCISRQLWWGHRIPAWSCGSCGKSAGDNDPEKKLVSVEDLASCPYCGGPVRQDEDVLDTWFSSQLWPFSTLGWPEKTADLERYYPTSVMETGYDILFFWVARMIMAGLKFTGKVPFRKVFLHGLVRDAHGKKMSKTVGNVLDPLELIDTYGADAVRFTLAILCVPGTDVNLDPKRMEGYKAFANKIWNASRFVLLQTGESLPARPEERDLGLWDRWILAEASELSGRVNESLESFRFYEASDLIYHFLWHTYCDWYVEAAKATLSSDADARRKDAVRWVLVEVLENSLKLLHPFMPFITEELWQKIKKDGETWLVESRYPDPSVFPRDAGSHGKVDDLCELITSIRNIRAEKGISPSQGVELFAEPLNDAFEAVLSENAREVATLAKLTSLEFLKGAEPGSGLLPGVTGNCRFFVRPPEVKIDYEHEKKRLSEELRKVSAEKRKYEAKLSNPSFVERAPREVVERHRELLKEFTDRETEIGNALSRISS
ncbi:MAG TPA: valine--tRNA ligase [Acidobacteriota bacterium]|jgi:valyl-tRNA synthetase|nr:valine--tRNA ligase [Acidobacteriota bacterium]HNT17091.1 valine--tRNA ligase [Acidobacteriota bacterium]HPA26103.1 valine--tRNA ligase [Acidobacteriota bacterium]HQO19264.1 valine--tRNA ligase [Acidobacteriota bacterium]HQQ46076.1 valine--tRNA ligase [Acidobacteriota bacterium]